MKKRTEYILLGIGVIILSLLIGFSLIIYDEKQEANKKALRIGCDAFYTIESWAFTTLDCYDGKFYNRMERLGKNGTFCFMNIQGNVRLKCNWNGGLE